MKKIGILTFHRALNYGAVLQAYALEKKMSNITDEEVMVELIDYRCPKIETSRKIANKFSKISLKNCARVIALVWKKAKFDNFLKKIKISKEIYSIENLNNINEEYDKIVVGSDQVWNYLLTEKDYTYLLNFKLDNKKKYSYAASLGLNDLGNEREKYNKVLNCFNKISVRENESVDILKNIGVEVNGVHLDPTLLLTGKEWLDYLNINGASKEKYILVYNILKPEKMFELAKEISCKTGYRIIYIPNGIMPPKNTGKLMFPNIVKFIELFANAEYIITNSFHGTVFSIEFHKKMLIELLGEGKSNARVKSLLKICNLEDRIFAEDYTKIFEDINWETVDKNLENARKDSLLYIKEILEN